MKTWCHRGTISPLPMSILAVTRPRTKRLRSPNATMCNSNNSPRPPQLPARRLFPMCSLGSASTSTCLERLAAAQAAMPSLPPMVIRRCLLNGGRRRRESTGHRTHLPLSLRRCPSPVSASPQHRHGRRSRKTERATPLQMLSCARRVSSSRRNGPCAPSPASRGAPVSSKNPPTRPRTAFTASDASTRFWEPCWPPTQLCGSRS
mmetsp:Transcript_4244/g.13584  ORF Transcript_4244/g.13584 Transcript_4244/m.13584 type:complete len:205 (+) Transcript_4244:1768-2382(+)